MDLCCRIGNLTQLRHLLQQENVIDLNQWDAPYYMMLLEN
jgi:hypothetical protein